MIVLVDGYNVLKNIQGPAATLEQRTVFVNLMGRYMKKRNHKVLVFFDGGQSSSAYQEKQKGVVVWFSGEKQSADDLIVEYAREHTTQELVVVTLDRGIKQRCEGYVQTFIEPALFYQKIRSVLETTSHLTPEASQVGMLRKLTQENDSLVDALMIYASNFVCGAKEEEHEHDVPQGQKLSKKKKAYDRIVKKL